MPKEVEIDGVKQTVYTEDEVKPLRETAESSKSEIELLSNIKKTLNIEEGEELGKVVEDLKNSNFGKVRDKMKSMEKQLKDKGVTLGDDGTVIKNTEGLTEEKIKELINNSLNEGLSKFSSQTTKAQALSKYSEEDRAKIEPMLDKVMALGGSIEENLSIAEAKVFPGRNVNHVKNAFNNASGHGAPIGQNSEDSFDKSDVGKSAASAMGLSFAKKDNK
jgi:hypothetical protein